MNIQQFQYVLAVVDQRNFEAAAEKCFVTQSTLSTMIGKLESEIGFKIFNRGTKPVSITAEGELIISRLRIIMSEIDSLKVVIDEVKGEMVGELRIGIIPTIAPYLLPLFLEQFSAIFPKIRMVIKEMTTEAISESILKRDIDIGILALPINRRDLEEEKIYQEPFLLYDCTSKSASSYRPTMSELDYSKLCLLQEGHCLRTQVSQLCELNNKYLPDDVNYVIESGSMDSLIRVTNMRKGMTILPYLATLNLSDQERSKVMWFSDPVPVRAVGTVTHPYFVKKKVLHELQRTIQETVSPLLPEVKEGLVVDPVK